MIVRGIRLRNLEGFRDKGKIRGTMGTSHIQRVGAVRSLRVGTRKNPKAGQGWSALGVCRRAQGEGCPMLRVKNIGGNFGISQFQDGHNE